MTPEELRAGVRAARKRKGLTQREFAELAGVTLRTYWAYETGGTKPQGASMDGILAAAGMSDVVPEAEGDWPPDIKAYLNTIGTFLEGLSDAERLRFMRDETRRIFASMRPVDEQGSVTEQEAEEARRAINAEYPPAEKAPEAQPRRKRRAG